MAVPNFDKWVLKSGAKAMPENVFTPGFNVAPDPTEKIATRVLQEIGFTTFLQSGRADHFGKVCQQILLDAPSTLEYLPPSSGGVAQLVRAAES